MLGRVDVIEPGRLNTSRLQKLKIASNPLEHTDTAGPDIFDVLKQQIEEQKDYDITVRNRFLAELLYLAPAFRELCQHHEIFVRSFEARVLLKAFQDPALTFGHLVDVYETCCCTLETLEKVLITCEIVAGINISTDCWEDYHTVLKHCLQNNVQAVAARTIALSACVLINPLTVENVRLITRDEEEERIGYRACRLLYRSFHESLDALVPDLDIDEEDDED